MLRGIAFRGDWIGVYVVLGDLIAGLKDHRKCFVLCPRFSGRSHM